MLADAGGTVHLDQWACSELKGMDIHSLQVHMGWSPEPNCEGLNDSRHAHGPHWLRLNCALSTVQRASHTSNGTVNYDFFILSAEDSVSFPSDSTRYRLIASNLRLYCFKIIFFIYLCWGVLCFHCCVNCSLSVERGGCSVVVCLGFSLLWFLLGSMGTGAHGLPWLSLV